MKGAIVRSSDNPSKPIPHWLLAQGSGDRDFAEQGLTLPGSGGKLFSLRLCCRTRILAPVNAAWGSLREELITPVLKITTALALWLLAVMSGCGGSDLIIPGSLPSTPTPVTGTPTPSNCAGQGGACDNYTVFCCAPFACVGNGTCQ